MGTSNSILIVSNNKEDIVSFKSKLMLLRDVDSIIESATQDAVAACERYMPETVVIFAPTHEGEFIEVCKNIKQNKILKDTPVLYVLGSFNEDFILSAFDAGMTDYLCLPVMDSEILMRVIWCMKQGETLRDLDKKEALLSELGVINKALDAYTAKYTEKVFSNEVNTAHKYKYPLVLMAISLDNNCKQEVSSDILGKVINKATRSADILAMQAEGTFLVILPRTPVKGACKVFERIQSNLEIGVTVCAGVCELDENMDYNLLSQNTLKALEKALAKGNSIIISDKFESEIEKSVGWDESSAPQTKNFKLFKQAFSKKVDNVISPVFKQMQSVLSGKYPDSINIDQYTTENNCYFSIKDPFNNNEAVLKISDMGLSKVELNVFYTKQGEQSDHQTKVDLSELNETKLLSVLENIAKDFENFAGI